MKRKIMTYQWTRGLACLALTLAMLLPAGCGERHSKAPAPPPAQQAPLFNFDVYRGVNANANSGLASLAPGQFAFNPELSTFDNPQLAPVQKPCNYRFQVTNLPGNPPPVQGIAGAVTGLLGYTATFDNNPPGHWSINAPAGVTPQQAAAAVSVYALANRGNVVNGTQQNCN